MIIHVCGSLDNTYGHLQLGNNKTLQGEIKIIIKNKTSDETDLNYMNDVEKNTQTYHIGISVKMQIGHRNINLTERTSVVH